MAGTIISQHVVPSLPRLLRSDIEFFLAYEGELEVDKCAELKAMGAQRLPALPPRRYGYALGLLGIRDHTTESVLKAAKIDAVFELIPYRARYGVPALAWIPRFPAPETAAIFHAQRKA